MKPSHALPNQQNLECVPHHIFLLLLLARAASSFLVLGHVIRGIQHRCRFLCLRRLLLDAFSELPWTFLELVLTTAGSCKILVVLVFRVPSVLHPWIKTALVYRLQIQRSLLVEKMSLDDICHVVGRHSSLWK